MALRRKPLQSSTEFLKDRYCGQSCFFSIRLMSSVSPPSTVSMHIRTPTICRAIDHTLQTSCVSMVTHMSTCVTEINSRMASNFSKLNPSETELIWLGSSASVETLPSKRTNYSWCSNQTNTACSKPWRDGRWWANDGESYPPPHPHVLLSSTSTTCGEEKLNYGHRPLTNQGAGA